MNTNKTITFCFFFILFFSCLANAQIARNRQKGINPYRNNYQNITTGDDYSLEIRGGALWAWGGNSYGSLGIGNTTPQFVPVQVGTDNNWVSVSAYLNCSFGLKSDGTIWAWGNNLYGYLGVGNTTQQNAPMQIGTDNDWVSISAMSTGGAALKSNGTLWTWGYNRYGQLGLGNTIVSQTTPAQVGTDNNWLCISGGETHMMALKTNGTLWAWGHNLYGELGIGNTTDQYLPVQVGTATDWICMASCGIHSVAIKSNGTLWSWGDNSHGELGSGTYVNKSTPQQIGANTNWVSVTGGQFCVYALQTDGSIWGWGSNTAINTSSPIKIGTQNGWVNVSNSSNHEIALQGDGTEWGCGSNSSGELGIGNTTNQNSPVLLHALNDKVISVSCGAEFALSLRSDGTIWSWGDNLYGQLGNGNKIQQNSPVKVYGLTNCIIASAGAEHSAALRSDGTIWTWGYNAYGALGTGNTTDQITPVQIGTDNNWVNIVAGVDHTLALKADGTLWAWGDNSDGELGIGNTTNHNSPVQVPGTNWAVIYAGYGTSFAIKTDGTLWAWGWNNDGQLGIGNIANQSSPVQVGTGNQWVKIAPGESHVLGLLSDGTLWAWGYNYWGQLGTSNNTSQHSPVQVGNATWINIGTGRNHSLAVKPDGSLWGWGYNPYGQLGNNDNTSINITPIKITGQNDIVEIGQGSDGIFSAIIKAPRDKICLAGYNADGELGNNTTRDNSTFNCIVYCTPATPTIAISSNIPGDSLCSGISANVTFTATITNGGTTPTYTWTKNGQPVGSNAATYNLGPYPSNGDVIICSLTSDLPCATLPIVTSAADTITVLAPVTPTINISSNAPLNTICAGTSVTFTAAATDTGNMPIYAWTKNGWVIGNNNATYATTMLNNGDTINCTLISNAFCISSNTAVSNNITTTVDSLPVPIIFVNSTLLTTGNYLTYQWYFHDTSGNLIPVATTQDYTITQNGSYSVAVKDSNGCTGESAIVTLSNAVGVASIQSNLPRVYIYPNPTQGVVYIAASIPVRVVVNSMDGSMILDENASKIDLSNMANAVYLIKIYNLDGMLLKTDKLIKTAH